jgi:F-type H+-transporting ATPase subunit epsilon
MPHLHCIVVTPEQTTLDQQADFVALPLLDGEIGIAPGHCPMIGRLGAGEMRLRTGEKLARYYLDSGFVQVLHDEVSVLTNLAAPAAELDAEAAQARLEEALRRPAYAPELTELRDQDAARARAQLRIARKEQ